MRKLSILPLLFILCGWVVTPLHAAEIDALVGKWSADREFNGQKVKFVLDIKKDTFDFEIQDTGGTPRFYAKGKVKAEKLGSFRTLTLSDMQIGEDKTHVESIDEVRAFVYTTGYRTLTLAANFDKDRDNEEAELTVYRKVATP